MVSQVAPWGWLTASSAEKNTLAATVVYLIHKHKQTYGSPRITTDLRAMGWRVAPNTVAAMMCEQGLAVRRTRRRCGTTKPNKSARKAPDLLRWYFTPHEEPNVVWMGSLTEISVDEGKLHLASVLNLHYGECPILP
ncbi:IS3 family transposase [Mycobacterium leprae]|uniref:IS3 family transposase n=1 Tax=Mycobacterium leprae TaxID=1769 RepID=UPI00031C4107|nr:IS3 family transposase [Mycobacterium leprae]